MKRLYIILYVVIMFLPFPAGAQSLSNAERRHINSKVLSHLEEYERLSSLYDEESVEFYKALFVSEDASVLCDMIGAESYLNTVSVAEYARTMTEYASNITVVIKDVAKGNMRYDGGLWHIPILFLKSVSYIDNGGYAFSTEEYHGNDFDMTMMLRYDPETDACLIESVTGKLETDRDFPKGRFFIVNEGDKYSERDMRHFSTLKVDGKDVVYNEFGQAILPSGDPYVDDFDVEVGVDTVFQGFNYDVVTFRFNPRKGRIKLRYSYAPLYAYKVTAPKNVKSNSAAMELSLDFGKTVRCGQSSKMGFYAGIGVSASRLELWNENKISYQYTQYKYDFSSKLFAPFTVKYDIAADAVRETVDYIDFVVPLYFELEHRLGKHVMLSWDLGFKAYAYMDKLANGNYEIAYSSNIDGTMTKRNMQNPGVIEAVPYAKTGLLKIKDFATLDVSAFAAIGLDINMYRRKTYFMLRAGYEYGFMGLLMDGKDAYSVSGTPYFEDGKYYPIVYDTRSKKDVAVHSLLSGVTLRRQALWFSTGFKFKF